MNPLRVWRLKRRVRAALAIPPDPKLQDTLAKLQIDPVIARQIELFIKMGYAGEAARLVLEHGVDATGKPLREQKP
jgi:hypothetical protein